VEIASKGADAMRLHRSIGMPRGLSPAVIAASACRLWPSAGPLGLALTPRRAAPGPRAVDRGAARGDIDRLR
jgi:hypothetical protein